MRTKTKLLLGLILTVSMSSYLSCKKTDTFTDSVKVKSSEIEEKFFNTHRTADPVEKSLVDFLKKVNEKEKFVEKTVSKIGYPRWDKAITKGKGNSIMSRNLLEDSTQTFYIPFVRDSQNFVNASMIMETSASDTSFSYKCDWQYKFTQSNINDETDSAEFLATFFMALDKVVFGHTKFKINDSSLFKTQQGAVSYVTLDSNSSVQSARNNLYQYVEFCENVEVYYPACGYPDSDECREGCDLCYLCWGRTSSQVCWGDWIDVGGGGTYGGGGGNNGGGSTPPDCGGIPVEPLMAGRVVDPCDEGPGWTPEPIEDDPPTLLTRLYSSFNIAQKDWWDDPQNGPFKGKIVLFLHENPSVNSFNLIKELIDWVPTDATIMPDDLEHFLQIPEEGDGIYDPLYWENPNTVFQQIALPTLQQFTQYFPKKTVSGGIRRMPSDEVYEMIGGELGNKYGQPNYKNACAIRASWAFNKIQVGNSFPFKIAAGPGTEFGANNLSYIVNAKGFNAYMHKKFGNPTHTITATQINGNRSTLNNLLKNLETQNVHGIYSLVTSSGNYSGHVDLMTFGTCLGGYSLPESITEIEKIEIWQLQ